MTTTARPSPKAMWTSRLLVAPVVLLLAGCSGPGETRASFPPSPAPSRHPPTTAASIVPTDAHEPLAGTESATDFGWEECSEAATAAFDRLASADEASSPSGAKVAEDLALLDRECSAGDSAVCNGLGNVYAQGIAVEVDWTKAVGHFRRGCDGEGAMACFNLALLSATGTSVPRDVPVAIGYYEKSCALGNRFACQSVALVRMFRRTSLRRRPFMRRHAWPVGLPDARMPLGST